MPKRKRVILGTGESPTAGTGDYLTGADWLWTPIPASPVLDTNSATWVNTMGSVGSTARVIAVYEYGVPVWRIPAGVTNTPRYNVPATKYGIRTVSNIPIPNAAAPAPGSPASGDGQMVVLDYNDGYIYEFYEMFKSGGNWSASSIAVYTMDDDGRTDIGGNAGVTGAGLSRAAGLILRPELEAAWNVSNSNLGHALLFSSDVSQPTTFRYPAVKTDGSNLAGAASPIPEGARFQLNPSYDLSALSQIQQIIGRTIQVYGAYLMDNGGSKMTFNLEGCDVNESTYSAPTEPGRAYDTDGWASNYGISSDYTSLSGIPFSSLRILKNWDGSA